MSYYNREPQLIKTLQSFRKYNPHEFFVVVVDDNSPEELKMPWTPFPVIYLKTPNKEWINPAPAFNWGFIVALEWNPDIIIIQNPECYHYGNIIEYAKKVTDETYISFGCYSQGQGEELGSIINDRGATVDFESAWYNHPIHRPTGYHFCSAITANNLIKINGFEERFAYGVAYDDNYLLHQIKCLGLKVEITAEPFVIHQWHERVTFKEDEATLFYKNKAIYESLSVENNHRAQHTITPDLQ